MNKDCCIICGKLIIDEECFVETDGCICNKCANESIALDQEIEVNDNE